MVRFCERAGVNVPRTHITQPDDDMAQVARDFVYPCLVKPIHRYTAGFPGGDSQSAGGADAAGSAGFFCQVSADEGRHADAGAD